MIEKQVLTWKSLVSWSGMLVRVSVCLCKQQLHPAVPRRWLIVCELVHLWMRLTSPNMVMSQLTRHNDRSADTPNMVMSQLTRHNDRPAHLMNMVLSYVHTPFPLNSANWKTECWDHAWLKWPFIECVCDCVSVWLPLRCLINNQLVKGKLKHLLVKSNWNKVELVLSDDWIE